MPLNHSRRNKLVPMAAHVGPNMAPMVDVTLVILIFFMLGSSLASKTWFLTNHTPAIKGGLTNTPPTHREPPLRLRINLQQRGTHTVALVGSFQTEDLVGQLAHWLVKKKRLFRKLHVQVLLLPDKNVPWQPVITVYSDCIRAGYKHVAFGYPR